jgi:hypothetical protein
LRREDEEIVDRGTGEGAREVQEDVTTERVEHLGEDVLSKEGYDARIGPVNGSESPDLDLRRSRESRRGNGWRLAEVTSSCDVGESEFLALWMLCGGDHQ